MTIDLLHVTRVMTSFLPLVVKFFRFSRCWVLLILSLLSSYDSLVVEFLQLSRCWVLTILSLSSSYNSLVVEFLQFSRCRVLSIRPPPSQLRDIPTKSWDGGREIQRFQYVCWGTSGCLPIILMAIYAVWEWMSTELFPENTSHQSIFFLDSSQWSSPVCTFNFYL